MTVRGRALLLTLALALAVHPGARAAADTARPDSLGHADADSLGHAEADSLAAASSPTAVRGSAPGDSVPSASPGRLTRGARTDTTGLGRARAGVPLARLDQPRWVMLRSLVFPGWGQFHNRAWWKGGALVATEGYLIGRIISDQSRLAGLQRDVDRTQGGQDPNAYAAAVTAYNDVLNASVSRAWLLGGVVAYAMLDAYVDAYFVDFDVQFKDDPALKGRMPDSRVQVAMRWRF